MSPDGAVLASASSDRVIGLWDMVAEGPLGEIRAHIDGAVLALAFAPPPMSRLWGAGATAHSCHA